MRIGREFLFVRKQGKIQLVFISIDHAYIPGYSLIFPWAARERVAGTVISSLRLVVSNCVIHHRCARRPSCTEHSALDHFVTGFTEVEVLKSPSYRNITIGSFRVGSIIKSGKPRE